MRYLYISIFISILFHSYILNIKVHDTQQEKEIKKRTSLINQEIERIKKNISNQKSKLLLNKNNYNKGSILANINDLQKFLVAMKKYKDYLHDHNIEYSIKDYQIKQYKKHEPYASKIKIRLQQNEKGISQKRKCKIKLEGIGLYYTKQTHKIKRVLKGYPAYKAGLKAGDIVLSVKDYRGFNLSITALRGNAHSKAKITISRNGKILEKEVIREEICIAEQK